MPFGAPGADWLLLGPGIELRHTDYDLEAAAGRIRRTHYPRAEDFASRNLLRPPSEAQILAAYAQAAGHGSGRPKRRRRRLRRHVASRMARQPERAPSRRRPAGAAAVRKTPVRSHTRLDHS